MGDYNTNILNSDVDHQTSDFLDKVYSNSFFPTINTSTCISPTSRTLTDNMFYNNITKNITSGNITTSFSFHLTQYLIVTNKHRDVHLKLVSNISYQIFFFWSNDRPSKTMKNVFYFLFLFSRNSNFCNFFPSFPLSRFKRANGME